MNNAQTANIIKELCMSHNCSISNLLSECNIRKSLIYDLEKRDYTPSAEVLEKIADYFNVSLDYLLGRTTKPVPKDDIGAVDFYRTLLSDKGILDLKRALTQRMEAYGYDKLISETGFTYEELRQFSYPDVNIGFKCLINLDKLLITLKTNLYDVIKEIVSSEHSVSENYDIAAFGGEATGGTPTLPDPDLT